VRQQPCLITLYKCQRAFVPDGMAEVDPKRSSALLEYLPGSGHPICYK
jgi:hypothetical protein